MKAPGPGEQDFLLYVDSTLNLSHLYNFIVLSMYVSHSALIRTETGEKIFVRPSSFSAGDQFLVINRVSNEIKLSGRNYLKKLQSYC